jgi:hypothetical protein
MTVAEVFDEIRDRLGVAVAADSGGVAGDTAPGYPRPTDGRCLRALDSARAEVNRRCNVGGNGTFYSLTTTAQTADGPYRYDVASLGLGTLTAGQLRSIKTAYWTSSTGEYRRLFMRDFEAIGRSIPMWWNMTPGMPSWVWMDSGQLSLLPAPSIAGTLYVTADHVLLKLTAKTDDITDLPDDCVYVLADIAARSVAASYPDDVEMRTRLSLLNPAAEAGINQICEWINEQNAGYQPQFFVQTGRQ